MPINLDGKSFYRKENPSFGFTWTSGTLIIIDLMKNLNKALLADLILVMVTMAWGMSNILMSFCLEEMGEMTLNAYRFVGAFVLIAAVMFKRIKTVNRETLKASVVVSILIFIVYSLNTYGIQYTSVSNAGFLIALSVLFTPIVSIFINKKIPAKKFFIIAAACTVGIGLMTLDSHLKMAFGDILCLLCAFFCGIYLVMNERFVKREEVDAFQVGVFELGFAGVWFSILAFIMEEPVLPKTPKVWGCLLFLMLFSTGFAFIAQSIAQQYTEASRVGVIYTLEPVFSRIGARLILHEMLHPRAIIGEIILVVSMIAMEVDFGKLFRRKS